MAEKTVRRDAKEENIREVAGPHSMNGGFILEAKAGAGPSGTGEGV